MKKSTKTMLLTAVALILVGGCFYTGAWAAGATGFYRDFGGFTISIGLYGFQIGPKEWNHHQQILDAVIVQEGTAEYVTGL